MLASPATLPSSVPWTSWSEWRSVFRLFWPNGGVGDASMLERALTRVATWRSRGPVPLAVDATAYLTQVRESLRTHSRSSIELRLTISMALIRLTNGVLDPAQQRARATSVSSLAAQFGLPRVLVDVRHAATHQSLPSLPLLKRALEEGLEWLRVHYWERQDEALRETSENTELLLVLKQYKQQLRATGEGSIAEILPRCDPDFVRETVVPTLLDSTKLLLKTPSADVELSDAAVDVVFAKLSKTWGQCIRALCHTRVHAVHLLLRGCVERLSEEGKHAPAPNAKHKNRGELHAQWRLAVLQRWTLYILETFVLRTSGKGARNQFVADDILDCCLRTPTVWTQPIVEKCAFALHNDPQRATLLRDLSATVTGSLKRKRLEDHNEFVPVDDSSKRQRQDDTVLDKLPTSLVTLEQLNELCIKAAPSAQEDDEGAGAWTRCGTWEPSPIGQLPGQPMSVSALLLPELPGAKSSKSTAAAAAAASASSASSGAPTTTPEDSAPSSPNAGMDDSVLEAIAAQVRLLS